jgi:hypothetical protein
MTKAIRAAFAALFVFAPSASGQPYSGPWSEQGKSERREWPPGPTRNYLRHLQRPDNAQNPSRYDNPKSLYCCDESDEVKTRFWVEPAGGPHPEDRWYAWLNDRWEPVPPEKIVPHHAPDGQAYLFVLAGAIQCFVRPRGGL